MVSQAARSATITSSEREQQRVAHLVLGAPRPKVGANKRKKGKASVFRLAPGIEEAVALREEWRGIAGTPETLHHVQRERSREGAIARLVATGALDAHQLAAAQEIVVAHDAIVADVAVRTAKLEPRGTGGGPNAASAERISAVLREAAYTRWREAVAPHAPMLLAVIVDDVGLVAAARRWRLSNRRARAVLTRALDIWRR